MANPQTILIVEDEKPIARALELKFSREGFDVSVASDGKEALELLESRSFDLILTDLVMPRVDGFGMLKWLKDNGKKAKVVVLSNLGQAEDIAKAKSLGAVDYFVKADTPLTEIVERVRKHLTG
jgi:DNA-binding response OmpR family regulator